MNKQTHPALEVKWDAVQIENPTGKIKVWMWEQNHKSIMHVKTNFPCLLLFFFLNKILRVDYTFHLRGES